jgi:hypothetical protein
MAASFVSDKNLHLKSVEDFLLSALNLSQLSTTVRYITLITRIPDA